MVSMETTPHGEPKRFARERERAEHAEHDRLRASADRSVGENLEEGLHLIAFAQQFQAGFRPSAHDGR